MSEGTFNGVEDRRTVELLEWATVLDSVARHCALEAGVRAVHESRPLADRRRLEESWQHYDELKTDAEADASLPLATIVDLECLLDDVRLRRGPLGAEELVAVGAAAEVLAQCCDHVQRFASRLPLSEKLRPPVPGCEGLATTIRSCLDRDGRVLDEASPRLRSLRGEERAASSRWRDAAQAQMRRARKAGWTTAEELTLRGDRYVVPVHARSRGQVPGIIHDRSATGATLYIEPLAVVEAANELSQARLAIREEEQRILLRLHQAVASLREELRAGHHFAVQLDALRARVGWARSVGGQRPRLGEGPGVSLSGYRHPPLAASLAAADRLEDLVPLQLKLEDRRALLVSGPNAGGKSLLLKSLATAALMVQSTVPVPADAPPEMPVFDAVLVELGDDQSIADALSSFSAHLTHLRALLARASQRSLVLLDEIGGGTDPQEGVALGWAVLEEFVAQGARVVGAATTHYGELKALVEEDPDFRHASMDFDPERLRPRFEVRLDTPGSSHALSIAEQLELPSAVLARARELVGDQHLRLDELLQSLQRERDAHANARRDVEKARDSARQRQQDYEIRVREWKRDRRDKVARAEAEAAGILRNARRRIERLLERVRVAGGDEAAREAARLARAEVDAALAGHEDRARFDAQDSPAVAPPEVELGARVRHRGLGKVGEVVDLRGSQVTLEIGGTRVVAGRDQLEHPGTPEARAPDVGGSYRAELPTASVEEIRRVDVRGMDVEEAWYRVDAALDRCVLRGFGELEVIHGKGTGRLRQELGRRLERDPRVRRAAVGGDGRYDEGVTLVEC